MALEKQSTAAEPVTLTFDLIKRNMYDVKRSLDATASKAECTVVHRNLVSGLNAICYTFLSVVFRVLLPSLSVIEIKDEDSFFREGVDFVFGAGLITAICLFILVILSACTWGQMDRHALVHF